MPRNSYLYLPNLVRASAGRRPVSVASILVLVMLAPCRASIKALAMLDEYARSCAAQYQLRLAALRIPVKPDCVAP
ncbi:MAG: hypothetical protein IPP19_11795 [Verrucomicrobia bacterium]|nr:hypothetical protein [Verrucomicrobiota bacterium]